MSSRTRLLQNLIKMLEEEEAANKGPNSNDGAANKGSNYNYGTNYGTNFGTNYGTADTFNNHGNGDQYFSGAKINGGAYAGNRNRYHTSNNYGDGTINNSGTFNGHGNGGHITGGFNASKTNYNYK